MNEPEFKILLVEDDAPTRLLMKSLLVKEGYGVIEAEDGKAAWDIVHECGLDLVLTDVMMPRMDGVELCRHIKSEASLGLVPVIICTALNDQREMLKGLEAGADDFLTKPVNEAALRLRLRNFLRVVTLQKQVGRAKQYAEELAERRTVELRKTVEKLQIAQAEAVIAQLDVLHRLAAATEYKDCDTGAHIQRIAESTMILARCLGWFEDSDVVIVSQASTLHDVGKIGIPDYILMKPGLLTTEEFEEMKKHTILGERLLAGSTTPLLVTAAKIARSHHEKWDGSGYPDGLKAEAIPPAARIVAVADVFDALRAQRCYKPEYPITQCYEMIRGRAGEHFDPDVVEAFMLCRDELTQANIGLPPANAA